MVNLDRVFILCPSKDLEKNLNYLLSIVSRMCMSKKEWKTTEQRKPVIDGIRNKKEKRSKGSEYANTKI